MPGEAVTLEALEVFKARGRFSRLLRRPSDPRNATVTASKRGGHTLILDILPPERHPQKVSGLPVPGWCRAGCLCGLAG